MPRFGIHVVKRGYAEITADSLDEATVKASSLTDDGFAWEGRDFEDCEPLDDNAET